MSQIPKAGVREKSVANGAAATCNGKSEPSQKLKSETSRGSGLPLYPYTEEQQL